MRSGCGAVAVALFGAQLAACTSMPPPPIPAAGGSGTASGVVVREDLSGRFIALIGPKVQFDPPFLGTSDTNFSCLRSFLDRQTGKTAHQLYVTASYDGNHDWTAAHDGAGQALVFIPMSRFKIACDAKNNCSYAEEFAAKFPESELSNHPNGFAVTFTDAGGNMQTLPVTAGQVAAQLAALAEIQKPPRPPPAAAAR